MADHGHFQQIVFKRPINKGFYFAFFPSKWKYFIYYYFLTQILEYGFWSFCKYPVRIFINILLNLKITVGENKSLYSIKSKIEECLSMKDFFVFF
jgi:hypothetical protein